MKSFLVECSSKLEEELKNNGHTKYSHRTILVDFANRIYEGFSEDEINAIVDILVNGEDFDYSIQTTTTIFFNALERSREKMSIDELHTFAGDYLNGLLKMMNGRGTANEKGFDHYEIQFSNGTRIEFKPIISDCGKPKIEIIATKGHSFL
ncbi:MULTISPECIES: hypothetical protein [Vibrio]|uniref:hypothetical protein n=1 Tax=Vibrio TaxID=662 RepID=UPI000E0B09A1|nr:MULTISPECIES: hypothetical protein [Vibrio]MCX8860060.1 hypothetical protein [Vibrio parahaemolyticus]MCX8865265.1 hypothetical protein [Vibrio parahaemolyticus]MCX8870352.1 hypothetical protein [Vibrio parahaemolyticus]MCX8900576.1 hypothetical protein [Vibrio parahaemolyticus]MCX8920892.1 hypothetical protein [Vibrio parahaemolyticus]